MKEIKGRLNVELSLDDANYINELMRRDTPMPVRKVKYGDSFWNACPICERTTIEGNFCPSCGQRLDNENYEI